MKVGSYCLNVADVMSDQSSVKMFLGCPCMACHFDSNFNNWLSCHSNDIAVCQKIFIHQLLSNEKARES